MPPSLRQRLAHEAPKTCSETKRLDLGYLGRQGMLRPGYQSMILSWSVRGVHTGNSIRVESYIAPGDESYLRLSYTTANGTAHNYRVELEEVPSNLPGSTARRFYLVCPASGRRATILYLREGTQLFIHRLAYPDKRIYYESQLEVKRFRELARYFKVDQAWKDEYLRKHRKTTYRGKPTKWFTNLLNMQERSRLKLKQAAREGNLWP